ncbi:MAG: hypothetical protein K0U86_00235 [Planctomycetes bacterium]|nr:hypothetical protein [Planctomycetota bacterium]MCH9723313.1 hypothetical protein [Planctomycetota bacterium]MCH9779112.1 hypothetical protein [Planctomycetota bacterium]MCH9789178.1 hypothetical protein [Planctomycetota bacterium]
MNEYSQTQLMEILDEKQEWLHSIPGVEQSAVGLNAAGDVCIRIFVDQISEADKKKINEAISDVPVSWEEGMEMRPYAE